MKTLSLLLLLAMMGTAQAQNADMPFFPLSTTSTAIAATITASTAFMLPTVEYPTWQEYVVNTGPQTAFVAFGGSAIAATTSSIPIPSGTTRIFTLNEGQAYVSAITATTTAQVYFVGGRGR